MLNESTKAACSTDGALDAKPTEATEVEDEMMQQIENAEEETKYKAIEFVW